MKKRIFGALALLLILALLSGCAMPLTRQHTFEKKEEQTFFDQIEYLRPRLEELEELVEELKKALDSGESLPKIMARLDACYAFYYSFDTMYSLADIRSCQDMTDAFYAQEAAWCGENYARVQQLMEEMYRACAASRLAKLLERQYFWDGFVEDYAGTETGTYNNEIVALMQSENALISQYRALTAAPSIEWNGRDVDFYTTLDELYDPDERTAAWSEYYRKYNGELAELFIALTGVRRELAEAMGYGSYEEMQYDYYFERDYTPRDAARYVADIKTFMVPFYRELMEQDPYENIRYDWLPEERLHSILGAAAEKIGGQVLEAYEFMSEGGYYDIRLSPTKADMSFETYLEDYEAPFLFLNPYGDTEDILSYSHEFGHYVDAYVNYNAYETVDLSECFSQAMEYLMLSCYGEVLTPKETDNLYRMKMLDTLELYVQQASFAEFESTVYTADPDELSADFLNGLFLRLAEEYGYYDGEREDYYAMGWMDVVHFFEYPFYVITYPVANDAAMQLYELEKGGEGEGMAVYLKMLDREREGLLETLTLHGLESPFAPGRIERVLKDLRQRLDGREEAA